MAFWGGAVPDNLGSLGPLHAAGVRGFKAFLTPSGVDEFGHLDAEQLETALAEVAALGSVLIVHAEDPADLHADGALGRSYADFLASRPAVSERHAIARVIDAMRRTGARAHVLHLSDAGSLDLIRSAKAEGLPLTVETCPHYLALRAEDVPSAATQFKCCPPIRDAGQPGPALGGRARRDDRRDRVRPLAVHGRPEERPTSGCPGAASRVCSWGCRWCGRRRADEGSRWRTLLPLFTTGPARVAGLAGRACSRSARPRTWSPSRPTRSAWSTCTPSSTRTRSRPTTARRVAGAVRTVWLTACPSCEDGAVTPPAGRRRHACA